MKYYCLLLLFVLPVLGKAQLVIQNGTQLSTGNGTYLVLGQDVNINSGATLNMQQGTLVSAGSLLNSGLVNAGTSNLLFNGQLAQQISGNWLFKNISLNNTAGASITNGVGNQLTVTDTYTPIAGMLTTNGNLLLASSVTGTARIAQGAGTYITGVVTQQRFVPAKSERTWSLVASPFTQFINNGWQQQVHITGAGTGGTICPTLTAHTNGFDATASNTASMYIYDGSKAVGSRWNSIASTNGTNLTAGTGFRMNIRGPRSLGCSLLDGTVSTVADAILSSYGNLSNAQKNMGSFTLSWANNGNTTSGNDNYLLIGNPYPCEISFSNLVADNIGKINNSYSLYAPGNAVGNYAYWTGSTWTGGNNGLNDATGNIIANGQAFFVQSSTAGANINNLAFNETQKTTGGNGYFRQLNNANRLRIAYLLNNGNKADEIMLMFSRKGTVDVLNEEDIVSMNNGSQYLQATKGPHQLVVNTRPQDLINDTINLNVSSTTNGNFKLNFTDFDGMVNTDIFLLDKFMHNMQLINSNQQYPFTVDMSNPNSFGKQRFAVVFIRKQPLITNPLVTIKVYPNPFAEQITVELSSTANGSYHAKLVDMLGRVVLQQEAKSNFVMKTKQLGLGNYWLTITDDDGHQWTEKLVR